MRGRGEWEGQRWGEWKGGWVGIGTLDWSMRMCVRNSRHTGTGKHRSREKAHKHKQDEGQGSMSMSRAVRV